MRSPPSSPRPRHPRWILTAGLGLLAAILPLGQGGVLHADTSPVVAKVGSLTITAAEMERRLAAVPAFQLRTLGSTPAEIKKTFLERVLVPEALFSQGAAEQRLGERSDVQDWRRGVLRTAMLARLGDEVAHTSPVSDSDIKAYYEANRDKFHSPERLDLSIIVVQKREEAAALIEDLRKDLSVKHFGERAGKSSLDSATKLKGGKLGFVEPDGTTSEPGLKASRAVVEAAEKVKDTELVLNPVQDGDRWVVVWRQQTAKAVDRPLEHEAPSIRLRLLHDRATAKLKAVLAALRKQSLTDYNPELCDLFEVSQKGDVSFLRRPGALSMGKRAAANPVPAPGGLR